MDMEKYSYFLLFKNLRKIFSQEPVQKLGKLPRIKKRLPKLDLIELEQMNLILA